MVLDRRQFLLAAIATAAVGACSSDAGDGDGDGGDAAGAPSSTTTTTAGPALASDPFTLGVASGDPLPTGVILWTRLALDPAAADGAMPTDDVPVRWQVAVDADFGSLAAEGVATAPAALGHSVHVDADGLDPDTEYHYRFTVSGHTSPVGVTRTFPADDASPDRFRFAVATCQDLQFGRYGAWAHAAADGDLDAVLFMGDYVYELPAFDVSPEQDGSRMWRTDTAVSVDDFRIRYAQVREDPALQAAHAMAPWIVLWDDHEVTDNYTGDTSYTDPDPDDLRSARAAAYQVWYEHMPVRLPAPADIVDGETYPVYRAYRYGDLIDLATLDSRQYADPTSCRETSSGDRGPGCEQRLDPDRTLLGSEQFDWLADHLEASTARWTVLGNPVMLAGFDANAGEGEPEYYLESWDGYVAERERLLALLAEVESPIVVTGDFHASFVLDVTDASGAAVAPEFLVTGISSLPFDAPTAGNPQVRYAQAGNGYLVCEVTPERWTTEFRHVVDVWDPASAIEVGPVWSVGHGQRMATES